MCGIVAGRTSGAVTGTLTEALARLEYRGYDSVGVAVAQGDGTLQVRRTTARVEALVDRLAADPVGGTTGVGHTRWATHGAVTEGNAHPHADCSGRLALVHNGIITNADALRAGLRERGHVVASDVDSEVVVHLVEEALGTGLAAAVEAAVEQLTGTWALAVLDALTGELVAASHGSPLVVAEGPEGVYLASDVAAVAPWIEDFRVLEDGHVVAVGDTTTWRHGGRAAEPPPLRRCTISVAELSRELYADFMSKEIDEQPLVAARVLESWGAPAQDGSLWHGSGLPDFARVAVLGCGTSLNAGRAVAGVLGRVAGVPTQAVVASEADDWVVEPDTLVLAFSQSGETADVLRALDRVEHRGAPVVAVTNSAWSALGRRADFVMSCHAGPEIGVAATKTYTAQVLTGTCLAIAACVGTGRLARSTGRAMVADLGRVPDLVAQSIGVAMQAVPTIAAATSEASGFLFLGRGIARSYADEGALKLKELSYLWAESHASGELKHGPLALVEPGTPVVAVDDGSSRMQASLAEVRARGGDVIDIGGPGSALPALGTTGGIPGIDWCGPLESVMAMQVLARQVAVLRGRDIDKPRNLAKSVTVE
ncbi:glutamine--fructose-6-phosphate transaminase (isomerizing) [Aeromicrobium sp. IC_218]|uniref:glutamine--fructose-6-phosphate transaminase (isomerizing) n=1 Tax=Aeromicrobium sp. IC_218 TaxID=2545468 RepID=UPI001039DAD0|nr:glutamine--fructose-6-phosphate transaminase (isomerizing) [Aeromicrobium sp. IC_218]TCI99339.1 glutamine--fructose-6-phosphate transaminase (isomerizing) [Aeromicrobium sp. IC_218]